ncbi:NAD-specific glutamate dehydrogenase [Mycena galericulata]|nr:NAD-specific glutamate dehydrogenase [Mycena galericulata]
MLYNLELGGSQVITAVRVDLDVVTHPSPEWCRPPLSSNSSENLKLVKDLPGYTTLVFAGKDAQRTLVEKEVAAKGFVSAPLVSGESPAVISDHIIALYAAKIQAYTKHEESIVIDLEKINDAGAGATFIHTSPPGVTSTEGPGAAQGAVSATASQQLRCYFVSRCAFPPLPKEDTDDIHAYSDPVFLEKASENTLAIYQSAMQAVKERRYGPVLSHYQVEGTRQHRLVIAYDSRVSGMRHFFFALSNLYHFYALYSVRNFYLNPAPKPPPIEHSIYQVMKEASLLFCLPDNPFFLPKAPGSHAVQEATYACVSVSELEALRGYLPAAWHSQRARLGLGRGQFTGAGRERLLCGELRRGAFAEAVFARFVGAGANEFLLVHPTWVDGMGIVYVLYTPAGSLRSTFATASGPAYLSLRNVLDEADPAHAEVLSDIKRRFREETFTRESIAGVISAYPELMGTLGFPIIHLLYVNFALTHYPASPDDDAAQLMPTLSYQRLTSSPRSSNEFRGFHIRFRDVARGGIRNKENYSINQRMLFDENYGLASTQLLKNMDIPEAGRRGRFCRRALGASPRLCFEKYVDSIVDLLIPGQSPVIKERLVDLYGKPELMFFGPDEGTADMMDWAEPAPARDAETLGGVPHDTYGMTSLSIRQYVLGIYKQLGLREKDITKVQTGGPDGDLGSNEILLSQDKTVAIIDGSGVLADPAGLDRAELARLAKLRVPVANFDKTKLGKDGYLIKVEEHDVKLPSGELVIDGTDFRNAAHLRFKADLFVPCGGRPEAVNISNMAALVDSEGKPHFKRGCTSRSTSSSLEVLAGLALSTQEYMDLMIFKDGKPNEFYQSYVRDVQAKITENAAAEFQCIWREHARCGGSKPRTSISDELSSTLNNLQAELESSDLFEDVPSREGVIRRAVPATLVDKIGLPTLLERLPEPYQRALFSSWVTSHFVYKYGVNGSSVDFFHFARDWASNKK